MDTVTFDTLPEAVNSIKIQLNELKKLIQAQSPLPAEQWFSIEDLMAYLPGNPSKTTIYSWTQNRLIPFKKVGKRLVFQKSEIDTWITERNMKTVKEMEIETDKELSELK